jgi:hypothetical protein
MKSKQQTNKSLKRVKAEGTQEFFNKTKASSFTFNKAPLNKDEAKVQAKHKFVEKAEKEEAGLGEIGDKKARKRSAFVAKLYRDDDDLDEMKVLAGDEFDSEVDEQVPERKRDKKLKAKSEVKVEENAGVKIGKLVSSIIS